MLWHLPKNKSLENQIIKPETGQEQNEVEPVEGNTLTRFEMKCALSADGQNMDLDLVEFSPETYALLVPCGCVFTSVYSVLFSWNKHENKLCCFSLSFK